MSLPPPSISPQHSSLPLAYLLTHLSYTYTHRKPHIQTHTPSTTMLHVPGKEPMDIFRRHKPGQRRSPMLTDATIKLLPGIHGPIGICCKYMYEYIYMCECTCVRVRVPAPQKDSTMRGKIVRLRVCVCGCGCASLEQY